MRRHIRALLLIAVLMVGGIFVPAASAEEPPDLRWVGEVVEDANPTDRDPIICYYQHYWPYFWICI